ncbi:MAG: hypothetical protein JST86_09515 [Bacteroidetes bacterium]|nr:hypothetical protein [Bacteroidota bacterium]
MSKTILILSCFFLIGKAIGQTVYTYSVPTIEGGTQPLSTLAGKKIIVITLPTQQNAPNDSLLHSLDSIRTVYSSSLTIIAVPAYEDGYTPANKNTLMQWYRSILGTAVIITDGLYTRKTSGSQQHPLFQWLTDKNKNGTFDLDVSGAGNKFILWPDGTLTSVLGAPIKLGGTIMNDLLQSQ